MGDTLISQTISTEFQNNANKDEHILGSKVVRQMESDLFGLSWHEPLATEEPYEGNLHVRICGEGAG